MIPRACLLAARPAVELKHEYVVCQRVVERPRILSGFFGPPRLLEKGDSAVVEAVSTTGCMDMHTLPPQLQEKGDSAVVEAIPTGCKDAHTLPPQLLGKGDSAVVAVISTGCKDQHTLPSQLPEKGDCADVDVISTNYTDQHNLLENGDSVAEVISTSYSDQPYLLEKGEDDAAVFVRRICGTAVEGVNQAGYTYSSSEGTYRMRYLRHRAKPDTVMGANELVDLLVGWAEQGHECLHDHEIQYMLGVVGRLTPLPMLRDMLAILVAKGWLEVTRSGRFQLID